MKFAKIIVSEENIWELGQFFITETISFLLMADVFIKAEDSHESRKLGYRKIGLYLIILVVIMMTFGRNALQKTGSTFLLRFHFIYCNAAGNFCKPDNVQPS